MRKKIVVLYSGGLDSFTMLNLARDEDADVMSVYYAHGATSEDAEIALLPPETLVMRVDWLGKHGLGPVAKPGQENAGAFYIPGRNMVFATLAACQFMPDEIWLGPTIAEVHEDAVDKNFKFQALASEALSYVVSPFVPNGVRIVYPLVERNMDKDDEIKYLLDKGIPLEDIAKLTSSCWFNSDGVQCGNCWMCLRRFFYFQKAAGRCPDIHKQDLLNSECASRIFSEYRQMNPDDMNVDQMSFYISVKEYEARMGIHLV